MNEANYVIGVDYGTDSVRSVLVDAANGNEISSAVFLYPRWQKGLYCNPAKNQFRQHPLDYIEGLIHTIKACLQKSGDPAIAQKIRSISVDTTGSTPIAVDGHGVPLSLKPGFEENPNAMFVLWKDHTAIKEANEINAHAEKFETDYLQYSGGIYSSEWFWSKLLHVLREDRAVRNGIYSWAEQCDWLPFLLCGETDVKQMKRSRCAAGHKALWAEEFGGLPPEEFFASLDPLLKGFRARLFDETYTSAVAAGKLSAEWAEKLGLTTDVWVGVGAFDAHMGAVGGQIKPYFVSKVIGTSTCDMVVIPKAEMEGKLVKGICGQVDGSIIPDLIGLEAGQSAFGDVYAWFKNLISWPLNNLLAQSTLIDPATAQALKEELESKIISTLSEQAAALGDGDYHEIAVDWLNGRRTPIQNQELKGAITGLNLGTDAPSLFRALAEATCFGAKSIIECYKEQDIPVHGIIGIGGVAKKSPYVMQMMADILEMPILIHRFEHTCALGAAMFAAVIAGVYPNVEAAMDAMGTGFEKEYQPNRKKQKMYREHYQQYLALGRYIEKYNKKDVKPYLS
ncbi:MAG: ribulokinase [Pedobacter sp.]|nr:ribulokinase [Pedobacter sp.]MDQ8051777.1 ribulokinase [Pedobacter sp.]